MLVFIYLPETGHLFQGLRVILATYSNITGGWRDGCAHIGHFHYNA